MVNDKRFTDDVFSYGYFCDCCSSTDEETELHTLDIDCPITLCAQCIKCFFALLNYKAPGRITKISKRCNLK